MSNRKKNYLKQNFKNLLLLETHCTKFNKMQKYNIITIETVNDIWVEMSDTEILNNYLSNNEIQNVEFITIINTKSGFSRVVKNSFGPTGTLEHFSKEWQPIAGEFVTLAIDRSCIRIKVTKYDTDFGVATLSNGMQIHKRHLNNLNK